MRCKSSLIELLLVCTVMVGALTLIPMTAHARNIKVTMSCPETITPGAVFNLGLTLQNTSLDPVTIAKSAVVVHLGNLDIVGPFVIPLSFTLDPWQTTPIPNYLSALFPLAPQGTFSSVGVAVMDSDNEPISEGWCNVEVQACQGLCPWPSVR